MRRRILLTCLLTLSAPVFADDAFVVRHIEVQGLQRVSNSAVMTAMPVHVGQEYTSANGNQIIAALFRTGFFSDVQLVRQGNTLVVRVTERPTIDSINITGNKAIKADQLKTVLKKMGIVVGNTFQPSELHSIVEGLQQQYAVLGQAAAVIKPTIKALPRNRVEVDIVIEEGQPTIVRGIEFVGNHAFSKRKLGETFKLTTPSIFTWFNHNDRYSDIRLDEDLQSLQNFYFDHGYLEFQILSHDTTPSPDGKGVIIHVVISEGPQYRIGGYSLSAEKLSEKFLPEVNKLLKTLKVGSVFSKKTTVDLNKKIGDYLADNGYAFPVINSMPDLNRDTHQVFLKYTIESGKRVYVRNIHIEGNTRTTGTVIRTQMQQLEGSPYSLSQVKESKRRIANLGYLDQIEVTTTPVPNTNNQVDLNYHVHEVSAGRASLQAGYSDVDGFLYGANVAEPNFLGSGRYTSIGFQRSAYTSTYGVSYNNPFYTVTGISRGFSIAYSHTTPANVNLQSYTMNDFGASMTYGIPISEFDRLSIGGGYDNIQIANVNYSTISPSVVQFLNQSPSPYNQFKLVSGISHGTLDRAIFPTEGNSQGLNFTLGAPIVSSSLSYYQLVYTGAWYFPMFEGFILRPNLTLGYGGGYGSTGSMPFFTNFYAGGIQTLPGYQANTLGPKNPNDTSQALGGNLETLGGLNLILPEFISSKVRTSFFVDAGNIFETAHTAGVNYEQTSSDNLRFTTGIMVSWWSPLGAPLDFSLGFPLNKKPGDEVSPFGFSFGAAI